MTSHAWAWEPSKLKKCTYDWDGPGEGPQRHDVLVTKTGKRWRVVFSRQVRSRVHPSRWALALVKEPSALVGRSGREFPLVWASRGPRA